MGIVDRWIESLDPADRRAYARDAYVMGFLLTGVAVMGYVLLLITREHAHRTAKSTKAVEDATRNVQAELQRMAVETSRAQRLALWVGVGTAVLGAIIGGFAGAIAAQLLG